MRKGNAKRIMSGFLATLTVLSTMMQPVTSFAAEVEVGETVTFEMPMLFAATGNQSVSITRGSWYHYADYGLGSYITAPYYVTFPV